MKPITDWLLKAKQVKTLEEACGVIKQMAFEGESEYKAQIVSSVLEQKSLELIERPTEDFFAA